MHEEHGVSKPMGYKLEVEKQKNYKFIQKHKVSI